EWQQTWIGYISTEDLLAIPKSPSDSQARRELIELRRTFDAALADSIQLSQTHDQQVQSNDAEVRRSLLDFERRHQPGQLRARLALMNSSLDSFRIYLPSLEGKASDLELYSQVLQTNLAEQPRTESRVKAVVDEIKGRLSSA
ncbi:MAG: hypothetical protein IH863_07975, partial [Chloroflexi bacterium]|nr:hypothetical protein [Chloroflexota bacterium]